MRASSSEASGSSISMRRGLAASARPMATRLFSPPERRPGPAVEEGADAEHLDDPRHVGPAVGARGEEAAVGEVLPHGQVREQPRVLEDVADAPAVGRHEAPGGGVDEDAAVDGDAARVRAARGRR